MKKHHISLLLAAMLLLFTTGCGSTAQGQNDAHQHVIIGSWRADSENHWHLCEDGEIIDQAAHTIEDYTCTECGAEVLTYEDGSAQVAFYNAQGNYTDLTYYYADGSCDRMEFAYNDDATWMEVKYYVNDFLTQEGTYSVDADGLQSPITEISYGEDGSYYGTEYDAFGELIIEIYTDAEGNTTQEMRYEHTYDADGNKEKTLCYTNGVLTEETEFLHFEDAEGSWSISGKNTIYNEDGSKVVSESDYENSTWSTQTTYDAEGNVTEELRYEYEKDENGEDSHSRGYKNGVLFQEAYPTYDENGEGNGFVFVEYDEDGGKTVTEYDKNFDVINETVYEVIE